MYKVTAYQCYSVGYLMKAMLTNKTIYQYMYMYHVDSKQEYHMQWFP